MSTNTDLSTRQLANLVSMPVPIMYWISVKSILSVLQKWLSIADNTIARERGKYLLMPVWLRYNKNDMTTAMRLSIAIVTLKAKKIAP